jgi:hypothetical protein
MNKPSTTIDHAAQEGWLRVYYFTRAAFSIAWMLAAAGPDAAVPWHRRLPCWSATRPGTRWPTWSTAHAAAALAGNRNQAINAVVSLAVAAAVAIALPDMHRVLAVFGAWAILSGLLQLGAALGRWKSLGAQWAMILSGAQSALAGAFFIFQAGQPAKRRRSPPSPAMPASARSTSWCRRCG